MTNTERLIRAYLAAEKLYAKSPAVWIETLLNSAYLILVQMANTGDEEAAGFLLAKEV